MLPDRMPEYQIIYHDDRCIEVLKDFFGLKVYRIPYTLMKTRSYSVDIEIKHVVYILSGKDVENNDCLYVGKSSNGTKNRPTDHEGLGIEWSECYLLVVTNSNSFNGGMAEYLEHRIKGLIDDSDAYRDITKTTTEVNANESEKRRCESLIPNVLEMLDVLGIDLRNQFCYPTQSSNPAPNSEASGSLSDDFSSLNMGNTINNWLKRMENVVKTIDPSVESFVKLDSKYVSFRKGKKNLIRCYPKKSDNHIDVFFIGSPELYSDSRVIPRPENRHDKPLDSMFVIRNEADLEYFRIFAEKAVRSL